MDGMVDGLGSAGTLRWGWLCQCVCFGAWADCFITRTRVLCMGPILHYRSYSARQLGLHASVMPILSDS
jgi:hypothetical protein